MLKENYQKLLNQIISDSEAVQIAEGEKVSKRYFNYMKKILDDLVLSMNDDDLIMSSVKKASVEVVDDFYKQKQE